MRLPSACSGAANESMLENYPRSLHPAAATSAVGTSVAQHFRGSYIRNVVVERSA